MAFVEVRFPTRQAVTTNGCSKGLENEGGNGIETCMSTLHVCRLVLSLLQGVMQRIFPKQDAGSLQPLFPWTAQAGAAEAVQRSPISAAHCLSMLSFCSCPLVSVLVVTPQFPQPHRYFTMVFPFASFP